MDGYGCSGSSWTFGEKIEEAQGWVGWFVCVLMDGLKVRGNGIVIEEVCNVEKDGDFFDSV